MGFRFHPHNNPEIYFSRTVAITGSSFAGASTGISVPANTIKVALTDMNGDGQPDLVAITRTYSSSIRSYVIAVRVRLNTNTTTSLFSPFETTAYSKTMHCPDDLEVPCDIDIYAGSEPKSAVRDLDFNGDGRKDLALFVWDGLDANEIYKTVTFLLSNGTGFTEGGVVAMSENFFTWALPFFANWNDDACTDVFLVDYLSVSNCSTLANAAVYLPDHPVLASMDWNRDGRTDLLVQNGANFGVVLSTGSGASAMIPTSIPISTASVNYVTVFDQHGDGLQDLATWDNSGIKYYANNGPGTPPDLVTSITDGFGVNASPAYVLQPAAAPCGHAKAGWNG